MTASFSVQTQINGASLGNSDGYFQTFMPSISWGPHSPRMIRHNDNAANFPTLRVLYPCYPATPNTQGGAGVSYGWTIMRRPSGSAAAASVTSWVQEATGVTQDDMFLLRDPASDVAILITFPNAVPTVYTSVDSFATGKTIPGSWQVSLFAGTTGRKYCSASISPITGRIIFKASVGLTPDHSYTSSTATDYIVGQYDSTSGQVVWGSQVRKVIGLRHAYDCLFIDPHPEMLGIYGVSRRDVSRTASPYGIFDVGASVYIFEGHKVYKTGYNDTRSWAEVETALDNPAVPNTTPTGIARFEMGHSHVTLNGHILVLDFLTNDGTSGFTYMARGFYLTVYDKYLNKLQDRVLQTNMAIGGVYFGDGKFIEDAYGRVFFLLAAHGTNSPTIKLYSVLRTGTTWAFQASPTDLSSTGTFVTADSKTYAPLSMAVRIAEPRGGNMRPRGVLTGESPDYQTKVDVCFMCRNSEYTGGAYPSGFNNTYPDGFTVAAGTAGGNGRIIYAQLTL